jgi:hypothetical protein
VVSRILARFTELETERADIAARLAQLESRPVSCGW